MFARSARFRYAPRPSSGPDDHGRRRATGRICSRKRLAQTRASRDACAWLADHPRQSCDQRDDRDGLHDARAALAAGARRGIARLLSLSAAVPLRPRRRRSAVSHRRRQARRGPRQRRATARDAPSAYFCGLLRRRRVDRSHWRGPVPARDRRARGRRPGRRGLSQRVPMGPGTEPRLLRGAGRVFRA